jgi:hypothetical protein
MDEEIILRVVRQVLEDPRLLSLMQPQAPTPANPELLVLLNYAPDLSEVMREVQRRWGGAYTLRVLATDTVMGHKPVLPAGMTWVTRQEAFDRCWQRMVLPTCSANTLAKIALGIRDTPASAMAAEGIIRGIPVELYTDYLGLGGSTPAPYRQLYDGYLNQVAGYGVIVRGHDQGCDHVMAAPLQQPAPVQQLVQAPQPAGSGGFVKPVEQPVSVADDKTFDWPNKLLAEKDILSFPTRCTINVGDRTIITPLAKDLMVRRQVEIKRNGDARQ